METVRMKEAGTPLAERFQAFPWILGDLLFPFMMEYLVGESPNCHLRESC